MSGDEAMARLKMHPSTRDIPVVVQTAYCTGNMTLSLLPEFGI
jgi:CheY-like chemotaxis protein